MYCFKTKWSSLGLHPEEKLEEKSQQEGKVFWEREDESDGTKEKKANGEGEACWSAHWGKCCQQYVSGVWRSSTVQRQAKMQEEDWEQPEPVSALLCLAGTHAPEARIWQSRPILNAEKAVFDPVATCVVNWNVSFLSSERKQLTDFYSVVSNIAPDKRYPPASCLQLHWGYLWMNSLAATISALWQTLERPVPNLLASMSCLVGAGVSSTFLAS